MPVNRPDLTLWHNPRCSKSRAALELLTARGIAPRVVQYLDTPPSPDDLRTATAALGIAPRDLLRTGESEYAALGLDDLSLDDAAIIAAMHAHPRLIERPVLLRDDGRAVVGRPPERVLELLD